MRDFVLALVAQESVLGAVEANLAGVDRFARQGAEQGAELVCFPELNVSGHGGHVSMIEGAEEVPQGPICQRLVGLAQELGIYLCAGLAERDGPRVYNTMVMVGPEGYLGRQRKLFLSGDEYFYFRHGTRQVVFELPFARVGVIICFDNEHPEPARCLAIDGAEVLLCPHAARHYPTWPVSVEVEQEGVQMQLDHWRRVHGCRALDNASYVGLCNAVGASAGHLEGVEANHAGGCLAFDVNGDELAASAVGGVREELLVVELKAEVLIARRNRACLPLRVRRGEVFGAITRATE